MLKVGSVILVMVLGMLAGCRTVPLASVVRDGGETALANQAPVANAQAVPTEVSPVVFVQADAEIDESVGHLKRAELLPSVTPVVQSDAPQSLVDFEAFAFQSNPTLAAAAARLEAARGRQVQAGLYPNPIAGYHATEIGNLGSAGQQGGFVSQRIITGGKLRLDQAIAGKEIEEAHFRFHAQEQRVLNDVRVRFYEAVVAQKRLELAEEVGKIGDNLVEATKTLLKNGLGTENNLLQAEIRAEDAHILLDNARNENVEAWQRLTAVIGRPTMPMSALSGDLDVDQQPLDWDESYQMVLGCNPELNAARTRVDRASIGIVRARREPIPNVDLSVSIRHHNVTRDDVANVQVGFPIPVFDRNQGNIRRAEAEWIVANNEVRRIELDLQDRLAVAFRRYANARQRADRYRQRMIPKARKSLALVTNGYEKEQVEYHTLLTAQQTHLQVNLAYLDSLQEFLSSAAIINGYLLSGSLGVRRQ
jgi:cobalt-zinc-cadmium efflux system outer membrane protein